ncbi:MAG TPA: leucyl aminopeptidase, partial [Woeseiaceae bacterium]
MNYSTTTTSASRLAAACLIVGVYESGDPGKAATELDDATGGAIRDLIRRGDVSGQLGDARLLLSLPKVRAPRVVVVGLGKRDRFGVSAFRQAVAAAMAALKGSKTQDIVNYLTLEDVRDTSTYYLARYTVETMGTALYDFSEMKSHRKTKPLPLKKIGLALKSPGERRAATQGAEHADAIVTAMNLARDLGNLPANVCTPTYLARTAQRLARDIAGLRTQVIGEAQMKRLGMNALLSVTSGTVEPAKLIIMHYKGAAKKAPIVLVGKGITFDTGGISLKPGPGMDEMKYDMCGAAAVMATMSAIATLALPVNVIAIVPACENLPSSTATRPGDIVKSMSGQTIEILNTDAEGRLILCDALTYARRFKPAVIVDVATLTGACVIALG